MSIPEIDNMEKMVDQFLKDGAFHSASRLISDTLSNLIRQPFALDECTKFLVHYTSVEDLFSILSCPVHHNTYFPLSSNGPMDKLNEDSGFLRMYDTFNANDPNEGQFFISSTPDSHNFTSQHRNIWELLSNRSKLPAYIASFRGVSNVEKVDDLIFWRTYGREGKGCAIVFPVSFLSKGTPVLQVRYGCKLVRSTLDHLTDVFDALSSATSLHQKKLLFGTDEVPEYITSSLSPISYLHKAKDYMFEEEVRVVVPYVDLSPRSLFCHRIHDSGSGVMLRHFAHLPELNIRNILRTNSRILLGPAVQSKSNLQFVLKRRLAQLGQVGTKICASKIDYRS